MTITLEEDKIPVSTAAFAEFVGDFHVSTESICFSGTTPISLIIPDSFLRGLADCDAGRVVDMDKVMNESPPS